MSHSVTRHMLATDVQAASALYTAANPFASLDAITSWTADSLARFPSLHFVCVQDGLVVGAVSATVDGTVGTIQDIAVGVPRVGIGSQLYGEVLAALRAHGAASATLWTHWRCASAIPFHYAHGFRMERVLHTAGIVGVPDGEDVIVLIRML